MNLSAFMGASALAAAPGWLIGLYTLIGLWLAAVVVYVPIACWHWWHARPVRQILARLNDDLCDLLSDARLRRGTQAWRSYELVLQNRNAAKEALSKRDYAAALTHAKGGRLACTRAQRHLVRRTPLLVSPDDPSDAPKPPAASRPSAVTPIKSVECRTNGDDKPMADRSPNTIPGPWSRERCYFYGGGTVNGIVYGRGYYYEQFWRSQRPEPAAIPGGAQIIVPNISSWFGSHRDQAQLVGSYA